MTPPIFQIISASSNCVFYLGAPPSMRFYQFGEAPQLTLRPYAVWQLITTSPANYLDQLPDVDGMRVQIDTYADGQALAEEVADAIRDAMEPHAYMLNAADRGRDPRTRSYGFMLDFSLFTTRFRGR